jgi:hypothetical protein
MASRRGFAVGGASLDVVAGALVPAQAGHDDGVQGAVGLAVAAAVEAVALCPAGGCLDGVDAAQRGEGCLGA